jgi:predicted TIM-barrel fold metal-dependent hydrolase
MVQFQELGLATPDGRTITARSELPRKRSSSLKKGKKKKKKKKTMSDNDGELEDLDVENEFVEEQPNLPTQIPSHVAGWIARRVGGTWTNEPEELNQLDERSKLLILSSFADLDGEKVADYHTHIFGLGRGGTGCCVHHSFWRGSFKKQVMGSVYMSAGGIENLEHADDEFRSRLTRLARGKPGRHAVLAFDRFYEENGDVSEAHTEFYTPNKYVYRLAKENSDVFLPTCSVHPYRADACDELEFWAARGVRLCKWLPNAMGIDPSSPLCAPFYAAAARLGIVLLVHCGEERAVEADELQRLGNPLLLRAPLDAGVKVIMAHCASLGANPDLDDERRPSVDNFELFLRMMSEPRYEGLLFADISATVLRNRVRVLPALLARADLHARLVNGSDYPLPAINILVWLSTAVNLGILDQEHSAPLARIYNYNALLFDFVLKRVLHSATPERHRFPASVFEDANGELDLVTPWRRHLERIDVELRPVNLLPIQAAHVDELTSSSSSSAAAASSPAGALASSSAAKVVAEHETSEEEDDDDDDDNE